MNNSRNEGRIRSKITYASLASLLLVFVPCFMFVFEDMIGNKYLEICILIFTCILSLKYVKRIIRYSWVWLLYACGVIVSLTQRAEISYVILDVTIIVLFVLSAVLISGKICDFHKAYRLIFFIGIINAVAVLFQFIMRETFNNLFWEFFTTSWRTYAERYYNRGYFSGIQPVPGETAGLIAIASAIFFIRWFINVKRKDNAPIYKSINLIFAIVLLVPLLMTGKKGVIIAFLLGIIMTFFTTFAGRKQWLLIIRNVLVILIIFFIGINYIQSHPNVEIFNRFNMFFQQLSSGEDYDTGRSYMYALAINEWLRQPILGMGWRSFRELTTFYGYASMHDVNFDYLQFLCEGGIVGFFLMIMPILITLRRTIYIVKRIIQTKLDKIDTEIILWASFVQLFTIIYAFFEIPFYDRMFFGLYAFSCIVINNAYRQFILINRKT